MLDDEAELRRLGYAQQLRRGMSGFGNFALSFSVISILTGAVSLYGYGLTLGGPIEMTVGWPLVSVMTLFVAISLAELASAYPTAGALYHWATILGGPRLGWWTAWLNLLGQVAVIAGVDYAFADFLREALGLADDTLHLHALGLYAVVLVSHGAAQPRRHPGGDGAQRAVGLVPPGRHRRSSSVRWRCGRRCSRCRSCCGASWRRPIRACSIRSPTPAWSACCRRSGPSPATTPRRTLAEETKDAQEAAPRGIVNAVWVSGVVGFVMLLVLTLAIGDLRRGGEVEPTRSSTWCGRRSAGGSAPGWSGW